MQIQNISRRPSLQFCFDGFFEKYTEQIRRWGLKYLKIVPTSGKTWIIILLSTIFLLIIKKKVYFNKGHFLLSRSMSIDIVVRLWAAFDMVLHINPWSKEWRAQIQIACLAKKLNISLSMEKLVWLYTVFLFNFYKTNLESCAELHSSPSPLIQYFLH